MTLEEEFNLPAGGFAQFVEEQESLMKEFAEFEEKQIESYLKGGPRLDLPEHLQKALKKYGLSLFV